MCATWEIILQLFLNTFRFHYDLYNVRPPQADTVSVLVLLLALHKCKTILIAF